MKIGNRDVLYSTSLIVPSGEDAWVDFHAGAWHVNVNLVFKDSTDDADKGGGVTIEGIEDYARITFINWTNSLGTATTKPVKLGRTNEGSPLSFMATHWRIGNVNRIDVEFLVGGDA